MTQHKRSNNPDFQARHYRKIAGLLFRNLVENPSDGQQKLVSDFADMFGNDNPSFSRDRFIEACNTGKGAD